VSTKQAKWPIYAIPI